jgi:thiamine kinase-like enzyme
VAPLLARAGGRPLLVAGVRRARGAWRAVALIHADLKHDNLLVAADRRIAVVDWEMARAGDSAWDLAGLMVRPLLDSAPGRRVWTDAHLGAAAALVSAYCAASGLKPAPIAQRLILYCGVWLVMSLIQFTSVAPEDDREAGERLLEGAEICFTRCDRLVARLLGAGDAG